MHMTSTQPSSEANDTVPFCEKKSYSLKHYHIASEEENEYDYDAYESPCLAAACKEWPKHLLLCSTEERKPHRFGMTWEWVNNDSMFVL